MLLSKHPYQSWREIQNQYPDYMTSLGPWEEDTIIEYLADEYPELSPHPQEQVDAFMEDTQEARVLTFARK
jgi:glutathione S-transferase